MSRCVDCVAEGQTRSRATPYGGPRSPRCATHWRIKVRESKAKAHGTRVEKIYGIAAHQYWELYAAQGGRCFICQRATGKTKRLAVDHDHETGEVRALLCSQDNQMIGRIGVAALVRAIEVLTNPPARKVLGDNA